MAMILAVDDSISMRRMVSFTLESAGHRVIQAEDGCAAFDAAKACQVDLVVTDVNMPNMDGITLIRRLRALPNYQKTPILILTTESADRKQEGRAAGATGWISKPFDPDSLVEIVHKVLGRVGTVQ
jgi:two-component system chemotaxis response regulator CheY